MAQMQDAHNTLVHAQWRTQGYAYYRAIWVECAEMLDHFGWKWWKKQTVIWHRSNWPVDIWHFALSEMLRQDKLQDTVADALTSWEQCPVRPRYREPPGCHSRILRSDSAGTETLAVACLRTRSFQLQPLSAMAALPMTYDELFSISVKTSLTGFVRTMAHSGGYRKLWQGREDNGTDCARGARGRAERAACRALFRSSAKI